MGMRTLILLSLIIGIAYCQFHGNYGSDIGRMDEKKYAPRRFLMKQYIDDHQNNDLKDSGRRKIRNDYKDFIQEYDAKAMLSRAKRENKLSPCSRQGNLGDCGFWYEDQRV